MPGQHYMKMYKNTDPKMDHGPGDYHNGPKNMKPDFLDLDKDGDKKESMKQAAKDKKAKEAKVSGGGPKMVGSKEKFTEGNFPEAYHMKMYNSPLFYGNKKD